MARVRVDTAGAGQFSHRVDIPYLDHTIARRLADRLSDERRQDRIPVVAGELCRQVTHPERLRFPTRITSRQETPPSK